MSVQLTAKTTYYVAVSEYAASSLRKFGLTVIVTDVEPTESMLDENANDDEMDFGEGDDDWEADMNDDWDDWDEWEDEEEGGERDDDGRWDEDEEYPEYEARTQRAPPLPQRALLRPTHAFAQLR